MLFDNKCYLCVQFAKMIKFFARNKIAIIGHYTKFGELIRGNLLDSTALQMFWVIDKKMAYGGRAALIPLLKIIIFANEKNRMKIKFVEDCDLNCKTVKAVFLRSISLFSKSKKIPINL